KLSCGSKVQAPCRHEREIAVDYFGEGAMRPRKRYYQALGVTKDATPTEVKRAYRALAKRLHPDRLRDPELARSAEERLKEINAAWIEYGALLRERVDGSSSSRRDGPHAKRSRHAPTAHEEDSSSQESAPSNAPRSHRRHASRDRYRAERAREVRDRAERE